jgi:hypothetical protein
MTRAWGGGKGNDEQWDLYDDSSQQQTQTDDLKLC